MKIGQRAFLSLSVALASLGSSLEARVQSYFNYSQSSYFREPYRPISRNGDDLEQILISEISKARKSLDIAVQEIRLPRLAQAIIQKHKQGVRVRLVLENQYNYAISEQDWEQIKKDTSHAAIRKMEYFRLLDVNKDGQFSPQEIQTRDAIWMLRNAGISIKDDTADGSKGSSLMHHKFVIVDSQTVLTGSANFTLSDIHGDLGNPKTLGNANSLLVFSNELGVARVFQSEFEILWGSSQQSPLFGVKKPYRKAETLKLADGSYVSIQFAPTSRKLGFEASTAGLIESHVKAATKRVQLALFAFSSQEFADTLEQLHQSRNIRIEALVERNFAFQKYSKLLDILGFKVTNAKCEITNKAWSKPVESVGVPQMREGDFFHHKFGIIDESDLIYGSQNWSVSGNEANDETLLVLENSPHTARFVDEFQQHYRKARLGAPQSLAKELFKAYNDCNF